MKNIITFKRFALLFASLFITATSCIKAQSFVDAVIDSVIVTPINLTSFSASKIGKNVQINWSTSSEKNNSYFLIQRSYDGSIFENISKVDGRGNSSIVVNYTITDIDVASKDLYYRLQQVDFNGKATFSNIILLKYSTQNDFELSISPNPIINGVATITFKNIQKGKYNLTLNNILGKTEFEKSIHHNGGISNSTIIFPNNILKGVQILTVRGEDGKAQFSKKIIIQ